MIIFGRKQFPEVTAMGFVNARVRIANMNDRTRFEELEMLADSGAMYSVVPAELLDRLGIEPMHVEEFELADGRVIERPVGAAHFTVKNRDGVANVIFGEPSDSTLLGVVALEQIGLIVDPSKGDVKRIHFRLGCLAPAA